MSVSHEHWRRLEAAIAFVIAALVAIFAGVAIASGARAIGLALAGVATLVAGAGGLALASIDRQRDADVAPWDFDRIPGDSYSREYEEPSTDADRAPRQDHGRAPDRGRQGDA